MAKKNLIARSPWLSFFALSTIGLCVYGELWARSEKKRQLISGVLSNAALPR